MIRLLHSIDWKTILLSLLLAMLLWFHANRESTQVEKGIPRTVRFTAASGYTITPETATVRLDLSGPERLLNRERLNDTPVLYRIPSKLLRIEGVQNLPITDKDLDLPSGITVINIDPGQVQVTIGNYEARLKVVLAKTGEPAPGYVIRSENLFPSEITVIGPKAILEKATYINTKLLNISGLGHRRKVFDTVLEIDNILPGSGVAVRYDGDPIRAYITVGAELATEAFKKVPIRIVAPANYPYAVKPKQLETDITLRGPRDDIEKLLKDEKYKDITLYVDVSGLKPSQLPYPLPLRYNLPEGIELAGEQPLESVDVDVQERTTAEGTTP